MNFLDKNIFPSYTKIEDISSDYKDRKIYSLTGQAVDSKYKGICISNGKKIIIR